MKINDMKDFVTASDVQVATISLSFYRLKCI